MEQNSLQITLGLDIKTNKEESGTIKINGIKQEIKVEKETVIKVKEEHDNEVSDTEQNSSSTFGNQRNESILDQCFNEYTLAELEEMKLNLNNDIMNEIKGEKDCDTNILHDLIDIQSPTEAIINSNNHDFDTCYDKYALEELEKIKS